MEIICVFTTHCLWEFGLCLDYFRLVATIWGGKRFNWFNHQLPSTQALRNPTTMTMRDRFDMNRKKQSLMLAKFWFNWVHCRTHRKLNLRDQRLDDDKRKVQNLWSRTTTVILRSYLSEQCQKTLRNPCHDGLKKRSGKFHTSRVFHPPGDSCFSFRTFFRVIKINVLKRPKVGFPPWRPIEHHGPMGWTCCHFFSWKSK